MLFLQFFKNDFFTFSITWPDYANNEKQLLLNKGDELSISERAWGSHQHPHNRQIGGRHNNIIKQSRNNYSGINSTLVNIRV